MSHWVYLLDEQGQSVTVDHHEGEGGTFVLGGLEQAELNVTYNYSTPIRMAFALAEGRKWDGEDDECLSVGIREALNGKRARDTVDLLEKAVAILGTKRSKDYWEPTAGNAGHALNLLLSWAKQHPDAKWEVD